MTTSVPSIDNSVTKKMSSNTETIPFLKDFLRMSSSWIVGHCEQ